MQSKQRHLITGTLTDQEKILHEIELVIVTKKTTRKGVVNETLSEIQLARILPVPDGGPYKLSFTFKGKQKEKQVHVKQGKLFQS